ncbi:MAG: preprotein translocase subunit YajC [Phycisphaerales bacterium]
MMHNEWLAASALTLAQTQDAGTPQMLSEDTAGAAPGTEGQDGQGGAPTPAPNPFGGSNFLLIGIFVIFGLLIFSQFSGARKEKKHRAQMLSQLGKHDRVQTVGGIIGSVVEIKGDELTLRVDESSNTRIRVARSAVQQVLKSSGRGADEPEETTAST